MGEELRRPHYRIGEKTIKEMRKRAIELSQEGIFSKTAIYEIVGSEYGCSSLTARNHVKDLFEKRLPLKGSAGDVIERLHYEIAFGRGYRKTWILNYQTDKKPKLDSLKDEKLFRMGIVADLCPACPEGEWNYLIFVERDEKDTSSWDIWIEDSIECKIPTCQKHKKREKAAERLKQKIDGYYEGKDD